MRRLSHVVISASLLATGGCCPPKKATMPAMATTPEVATVTPTTPPATQPAKPDQAVNPLTQPWVGEYGGVPAFDKVRVADMKSAMQLGMAENLREVDAIANNPEPATFQNTIEAMERAGQTLSRVGTYFGIWAGSLATPDVEAVETEMSPLLAELSDKIIQNKALWTRIEAVYNAPATKTLTAEQQRLAWLYWNNYRNAGAMLDATQKATLGGYNQRLASLYTTFGQHQLADEGATLTIDNKDELTGLAPEQIAAAAELASKKSAAGKWMFANTRSAMEPLMTYASNRTVRERAFKLFTMRGDNGDANDNNKIVAEILLLRAKKAKLLGSQTYAHLHLLDTMAQKPEKAMALMMQVWKPAVAAVKRDVAEMQKITDKEQGKTTFKLAAWDYRYYAEKLRKAKFDLDLNEVKPYLQVENLREAMFWVANQIYGFTFIEVQGLPVFHPDVRVYQVKGSDGKHVGLWYFDPYARDKKRSGAWMSAMREQQRLTGDIPTIVSNNSNFIKPVGNEPATISWSDARTMFHEFGHALHGLNSNVTYPSLSGTNTMRDHVEFPSQVNEGWLSTPQVLERFLKNAKGEVIPPALVAKLKKAATFNTGFGTVEGQSSAIVDMKLHLAGETPIDPKAFEAATLKELGMPSQIVMRHRIPQFGHVFSGEGYAAGYYGYIWAEVLARDAFEAFTETGNPFDPGVAKRLRDNVMSVGNTIDPAEGYKKFRGREPKVDALLRDRGFAK
jgi:peptidyl-dipeptidase Dcp